MLRLEYIVYIGEANKNTVHIQCHVSNVNQDELLFRLGEKSFRFEGKDEPVVAYSAKTISDVSLPARRIDQHTWRIECMGSKNVSWKYHIQLPERYITYMDAFVTDSYAHIVIPQVFMALEPIVDAEVYVKFNLPHGWNVITLWSKEDNRYRPIDLPALSRGYMALGDYQFYEGKVNDAQIKVAISKEINCNPANFFRAVEKLARCQADLFFDRVTDDYLIICNSSGSLSSGGSPSGNMVSIALPINFTDDSLKEYRGRLPMINHELLHTWITNRPKSGFWYSEGFVCYYALLIACRAHYITQNDAYQHIYNVYDQYINNKYTSKLSPVQAAEKFFVDHHDAGVYCGNTGFLFALLLDVEIRYATQNQRSLDHLMRRIRQNFAPPKRGWTYDELKEIVDDIAGIDVLPYIEQYIEGTEVFPITDVFDKLGLEIRKTEDGIKVIESRKATELANNIRSGILQ